MALVYCRCWERQSPYRCMLQVVSLQILPSRALPRLQPDSVFFHPARLAISRCKFRLQSQGGQFRGQATYFLRARMPFAWLSPQAQLKRKDNGLWCMSNPCWNWPEAGDGCRPARCAKNIGKRFAITSRRAALKKKTNFSPGWKRSWAAFCGGKSPLQRSRRNE